MKWPHALWVPLAFHTLVHGQGFSPADAVQRMKLPPGFQVTCVAHEPMIRQPLSVAHDDRGRMWVLQYLQYPNPAGLKPVKQDQYLRTIWDRVPEPPPRGPRGLDRITICYDPDANGVYQKSKDFITGLNLATGFCVGHGGVYVVQPPYLLYYADKDQDDVPDSDTPEVLLSGFGMEDTHSYANSLQWGPDGWLYGAHGSTVTAKIKNPAYPDAPVEEFQQGIWRFHPRTKKFELFSEGGGNTYGLDFDRHGQVIAGTNYNNDTMIHKLQGAYYVKGFSKHGPLHNAHTYGYFDHVPHQNFKGGHVTCGGVVYQGDTYPTEMQDQYIAGNLLANDVYWSKINTSGSTFTSKQGGDFLLSNDTWCRPVDLMVGPEGSVYIADWYDKRAAHLDPVDNWDKTNGRIYRVDYTGTKLTNSFDLRKKSSAELCELLKHPNAWWRREARRLLAERRDQSVIETLLNNLKGTEGLLPLESLWALYGMNAALDWKTLLAHPQEHVRAWGVRLIADDPTTVTPAQTDLLIARAGKEISAVVRAQLACTAKRLSASPAVAIVRGLLAVTAPEDQLLPNLLWWAVESRFAQDPAPAMDLANEIGKTRSSLFDALVEKIARRLMASDVKNGKHHLARLIQLSIAAQKPEPILRGMAAAVEGGRAESIDPAILSQLVALRVQRPKDDMLLSLLARMADANAIQELRTRIADEKRPQADRVKAVEILRQVHDAEIKPILLKLLRETKADSFRIAVLVGIEAFDDDEIGKTLLELYPTFSAATKRRAVQSLVSRKNWALSLFQAVDSKAIPTTDIPTDQLRTALSFEDPQLTKVVEKHYGKVGPSTPGEKQARITWLNREVGVHKGDLANGKALFKQHCANCHMLFGEGNKIGPDLTTADRKNLGYMISQVVDPSAMVRPEYVQHTVSTLDGRKLSGIVVESSEQSVTLVDAQNNQSVIAKADIEELKPSGVSLMPEKLLDTLSYQQVTDLFTYLRSDPVKP